MLCIDAQLANKKYQKEISIELFLFFQFPDIYFVYQTL
jgi:hypothetical protein